MYFIAGCTLLVIMSALRWAFDAMVFRQAQSLLAILFPAVGVALLYRSHRAKTRLAYFNIHHTAHPRPAGEFCLA